MIIALDFDKTYNIAPSFWDDFIVMSQEGGHKVILATYRHKEYDWDPLMDDLDIDMYFTDGKCKRAFLHELGVFPDIWIDDNPESIIQDSAWAPTSPELHAWRVENTKRLEAKA